MTLINNKSILLLTDQRPLTVRIFDSEQLSINPDYQPSTDQCEYDPLFLFCDVEEDYMPPVNMMGIEDGAFIDEYPF